MNSNPQTCQPQQIGRFLQHLLTDREQQAFESHLDACGECQRQLERQTARSEVWATVRDSLSSEEFPLDTPSGAPFSHVAGLMDGEEAAGPLSLVLSFLSPTDDPRMLGRLGAYEIVGIVGQGGMGIVLKGLDPALNRYVAIKVLSPHLAASGSARRRFAREAQAAAAVTHENVIAIHGVSEWNGLPYLVMPYVRGESLQKRLDQQGPQGVSEVLRVGRQVAAGLAAAHAQGLVHRDIKPANILLEDGVERLQITDFGLARAVDDASLTRTGVIAGTPQYMSPEQARGEVIDARSDLFSLGSTMYALCTGRPPFRAETSYGILRRITDSEPRPICEINHEAPVWLVAIIHKLLAKDLADRFESAAEVALLLEQCLAHVRQPTLVPLPRLVTQLPPVSPVRPQPAELLQANQRQRHHLLSRPVALGAAGLAFVLVASVVVGVSMSAFRGRGGDRMTNPQTSSSTSVVAGKSAGPPVSTEAQSPRGETRPKAIIPADPAATSEAAADTAWDATAQEVDELLQSNDALEARAAHLWDVVPGPSTHTGTRAIPAPGARP